MSFSAGTYRIEDLISAKVLEIGDGYRAKNSELSAQGLPFARAANINDGFKFDNADFFPEANLSKVGNKVSRPGDVVFTSKGTVGRFALVDTSTTTFVYSPQLCFWRSLDQTKLLPEYLYYWMNSAEFLRQVSYLKGQTDMADYVSLRDQRKITATIPAIDMQRQVVSVLKPVDDRIYLLRETNAILEAIAQALFKSWFVDFDPVRAKQEGREPEGMDAETAALFPDRFEESETGPVPVGWIGKAFGEFIDRISVGKKYDQKSASTEGRIPILDQGKSGIIGFHNDAPGVKASFDDPVVVFANHTCYMRLIPYDFSAIQNVLPFTGRGVDTVWAFYATKDKVKFSEYKGHWPEFAIQRTVVPSADLTVAFRTTIDPLLRRIRLNETLIESLSAIRDTLLPRLISGQLRLPEAEEQFNEALTGT